MLAVELSFPTGPAGRPEEFPVLRFIVTTSETSTLHFLQWFCFISVRMLWQLIGR